MRVAARSAGAAVGGQLARAVLQLAGLVVVARLLGPADYGLLGMAAAGIGVAEIVRDLGLSAAAVRVRVLTDAQRDALFWLNAAGGVVMATLLILAAPVVAGFFHQDAVTPVARALAFVPLVNGLAAQPRAQLTRDLRFGLLARIELAAVAGSLVLAVPLAAAGVGVWALVAQQVSFAVLVLAGLAGTAGWWPGPPRAGAGLRPLVRFGVNLMLANLLGHAARNADSLVVGRVFGPAALGAYDRAYQLLLLPLNQVNAPLSRVALPVLSRLRDERERFLAFALRGQTVLVYGVAGGFTAAIVVAEPGFALLFGPRWDPAVPLFQLLAVGGIFQTAAYVCDWAFLATGRSGSHLRYCLVTRPLLIALTAGGALWGPAGVAAGFAAGAAVSWPVALVWLHRATGLPALRLFASAGRALLGHAAAGAVAAAVADGMLSGAGAGVRLAAGLGVLAGGVGLLAVGWPAYRRDLAGLAFGRGPQQDVRAAAGRAGRPRGTHGR